MSSLGIRWPRPLIQLRRWIGKLSLALIFHALCIALILTEVFLAWLFLFESFNAYYADTQRRLDQTIDSVADVVVEPDVSAILESPWALADIAPLGLSRLDDYPLMENKPGLNWDELRRCRRIFTVERLQPIDVCVGVLAAAERWQADFQNSGKYVYLTIKYTAPPPLPATADRDWQQTDHVEIEFVEGGRVRDRIALIHERQGSTGLVMPSVYSVADGSNGLQLLRKDSGDTRTKGSMCALRLPTGSRQRVYLCRISGQSLSSMRPIATWPPADKPLLVRVAAMVPDQANGAAAPYAATFSGSGATIRDWPGKVVSSLPLRLKQMLGDGDRVAIFDSKNRMIWSSSGLKAEGSLQASHEVHHLAKKPGYRIEYFSDPVEVRARWASFNLNSGLFTVALLAATLLVYVLIFRLIIQRIVHLSKAVEGAALNPENGLDIRSGTSDDEIDRLAGAFNILLRQVTNATKRELETLKMIGHEIRSPLQTILAVLPTGHPGSLAARRMANAVESFASASSPAEAFASASIVSEEQDLRTGLAEMVANVTTYKIFENVHFEGSAGEVFVQYDPAAFADALEHILQNAVRHRTPQTPITISLSVAGSEAIVDVDNAGPPIPDGLLDQVFDYGVTTQHDGHNNLGQGLTAAKAAVFRMHGSIKAINLSHGVRFRMIFPLSR